MTQLVALLGAPWYWPTMTGVVAVLVLIILGVRLIRRHRARSIRSYDQPMSTSDIRRMRYGRR